MSSKCFDPNQETRSEMIFEGRSSSAAVNNKKTIVHGVENLKAINKQFPTDDFKTQVSTKENAVDVSDIKLVNLDTAVTTPRSDIELQVVESDFLQVDEKFRIQSNGQINGKKTIHEKKILIGSDLPPNAKPEEGNDIVCSRFQDKKSVQSAQLTLNKGSFYLKDLGGGDGIYIKAEDKYALENHCIVHYGIGHLITEIITDKEKKTSTLKLKFMDGPNEGKERIIQPGQVCTVGRLATCTIVFDEYGVSRIQCK